MLKYFLSRHLFLNNLTMHEGLLSQNRAVLCCNRFLYEKAVKLKLTKYPKRSYACIQILLTQLTYIACQSFQKKGRNAKTKKLSDKTVADCVESLIGATYQISEGSPQRESVTLTTCLNLGIPVFSDYSSHLAAFSEYVLFLKSTVALILYSSQLRGHRCSVLLSEFSKSVLGYTFQNEALLESSFTHASKLNSKVDCYQRLEFLGKLHSSDSIC